MKSEAFIAAHFPGATGVQGLTTLRAGGVSEGKYASLNLAAHVGDAPENVQENRRRLAQQLALPASPLWLDQCHGTRVAVVDDGQADQPVPRTDAAVTRVPGRVLAVLTADCLPVLLSAHADGVIGVAHAGWRGLAAGVLENTLAAMRVDPAAIVAWLGPAIGAGAFEVGDEVRAAFMARDAGSGSCFAAGSANKWYADLAGLARRRLAAAGVTRVCGGQWCTVSDPGRYFSYRRDGECGRMASLLWMTPRR